MIHCIIYIIYIIYTIIINIYTNCKLYNIEISLFINNYISFKQ